MILKHASFLGADHQLHQQDIRVSASLINQISDSIEEEHNESVFDCSGYIILPTFADCHVHTPDTLLRGLFCDMEMASWCNDTVQGKLQQKIYDYLDNNVASEDFKTLVLYAYMQYIKNGVGFIVETGQADNSSAILQECAQQIGLKALVDYYEDYPPKIPPSSTIAQGIHLHEEEELNKELLEEAKQLFAIDNPFLMTHCLETTWRRAEVEKKFGMSTIELLAKAHLLSEKSVLFHCIETSEQDINLLGEHHANVVHCPLSNSRAGEGSMNLCAMLKQNINITLGTDYLCHDIWDVMRATYGELKQGMRPELYGSSTVLDMASRNAAVFSSGTGYQGTIEEGSGADLLFLKAGLELSPLVNLPGFSNVDHNLLMYGRPHMIEHVMINGKWIMQDRKFMTIDEQKILASYAEVVRNLFVED